MNETELPNTADARREWTWLDTVVGASPLIVIGMLWGIYKLSADFYLTYVLVGRWREGQAVEVITVLCALAGGFVMAIAAVRLWRSRSIIQQSHPPFDGPGWLQGRLSALHVAMLAAAAIFFGGEEINWGQIYFVQDPNRPGPQLNLHNAEVPFSVQSLGSLFLIVMFIVVPIMWHFRKLPGELALSIPRWSIAVMCALSMLSTKVKTVYVAAVGEHPKQYPFYRDFLGQINEQKEMLLAMMLLVFGLYCLAASRRLRSP